MTSMERFKIVEAVRWGILDTQRDQYINYFATKEDAEHEAERLNGAMTR